MKKILTICPSRERHDRCQKMYDSFKNTSTESDLVIYCDADDPQVDKYASSFNYHLTIGERGSLTQTFNKVFNKFPNYKFYHLTNDDFVYRTEGWDKTFIRTSEEYGHGIFYGNDLLAGEQLPTAPMISGEIIRSLGFLQLPDLKHLCGDVFWLMLGKKLNCLYYHKNVIIEHQHFLKDIKYNDESYKRSNSFEMYEKDNMTIRKWIREGMEKHTQQLKEVINGKG